jgi:3'-phosphoadenosine 5'-phosphosulfate sulfotransferase (PAPS reductase)/FAD synthetase
LWVRNATSKNFETVFCDTGWESDITYNHIQEVKEKLGLNLIVLKSTKHKNFIDLVKNKSRFPSSTARFCTEELKTKPMIDYILDQVKDHVLIIQGIRAGESEARSKMKAQCNFFKYYLEPYQTNSMIVENLSAKKELTKNQLKKLKKAKDRLLKGKEDAKFHTYRKKEVLEYFGKYVTDVLRPVFDWTGNQVMKYILENGLKPNPLYYQGFKRVGCFPCIMSGHTEMKQLIKHYPGRIDQLREFEKECKSTFFYPDYIPKRFMANKKFPTIDDVVNYVKAKNASGDLFPTEETSCISFYSICE